MKISDNQRRRFLKLGGVALTLIPALTVPRTVLAARNASMRTALKYQDKPNGDKRCTTCMHFVPGKTAADLGGCKLMPGDTEISPNGYCVAWAKKT
jgi:hypothetical protein